MFGCVELAAKFWVFHYIYMPVLCGVYFAASDLEDDFCFSNKAFWYCHVQFVSLTWNQRFVSSWTSCVWFAGHIRYCPQTDIISSEFLFGHLREDTNCHRWNLNMWCSSFINLWITTSGKFRSTELFAEDYHSGLNFHILCHDIKTLLQWRSSGTGYTSAVKIR